MILIGYVLDHMLDHMLDEVLDHMIIGFVITALEFDKIAKKYSIDPSL